MTTLEGGGATDVGRVRKMNEDYLLVSDALYAVADGVGGHQAGEVASQTAIETLAEEFNDPTTDGLVTAIKAANEAVWRLAQDNAERRGMGTTITAVALVEDDAEEHLAIVNVGDSRAYLFRSSELAQISEDHSLVEELVRKGQLTHEEAQVHPQRSIITRALGMEPEIEVDYWQLVAYRGDRILLCSDGLTNEVSDDRIASTLRQIRDPKEAARDLVRQARDHGGNDNITVVIVDVVDDDGRSEAASEALEDEELTALTGDRPLSAPTSARDDGPPSAIAVSPPATAVRAEPRPEPRPPTQPSPRRVTWRVVAFLAAFAIVIAVGVLAVSWYARNTYYVGLDNDRVAIFRGRPGGFLWFEPTLQERKTLTTNEIFPSRVTELRAGKEEPSKAAADRYVNQIRQEGAARVPTTTTTAPAPATTIAPQANTAPVPP
ncbi:MAG TPA: Stp1/IreP family PP2C-type Ser/Thr phosphatase [Acidimicrobiales bacterium]|nr:Stp1/IreP family PP2C-type Ser/Thr phosphatase [Acidimicrobiales bacterium]